MSFWLTHSPLPWLAHTRSTSYRGFRWLIQNTSNYASIALDSRHRSVAVCSWLCRYVADSECDVVFDYLAESMPRISTIYIFFAACLVLDKWTCNVDGRQLYLTRHRSIVLSQHGSLTKAIASRCEWRFSDSTLRGVVLSQLRLWPRHGLGCF